jgi:acetyl coenzyme A synthetase (ADP forming)-like protein
VSASTGAQPRYPAEHEADVALRDGSTVHVRPVRAADREAIQAFLGTVSAESIAFRFFGTPRLEWIVQWSLDVDYTDRFALVAESGTPRAIVAHAAYVRESDTRAEVAFLVADSWQGRGISTILLAHLAALAERQGITTLTAQVLPANHRMIGVFRASGFPVEMRSTSDAIVLDMPTSLSAEGLARFEERERRAAVAAVRSFLEPASVAVIGASRRRGTIGGEILRNLLDGVFSGPVYAVHDHADVVQSLPAYRSVRDIPRPVELAVVVVPAERVCDVARDCAAAGVRALLVVTSGFAETGELGARRQSELLAICRDAGMRVVGPNCLGVLNTAPAVSLNATFAPHPPVAGAVGFMSQSGALGIAMMEAAGRLGVGLSSFVSVGNKADLSGNDMLSYWEQDPGTRVALLYLESFGNPRKFARIAPRFARRKPLLAVKSGRSSAGASAVTTHTGALLSASDVTVDALFEQAGVIRADTLHDLYGVAALLTAQPIPRGDRVAIVSNAGGPGVMCADACQAEGVEVPELPAAVREQLAGFLAPGASLRNPVDIVASASAVDYERTLRTILDADACDAVLVLFVPSLAAAGREVAEAVRAVAQAHPEVTFAAAFMTSEGPPPELRDERAQVPGYAFPEDAARAVALAAKHGRWRARAPAEPAVPDGIDASAAAALLSEHLADGPGWLAPERVLALLRCYGLPVATTRLADGPEEAAALAEHFDGPVAVKALASGPARKAEAGGVQLGVLGADAVRAAAGEVSTAAAAAGYEVRGVAVQAMAPEGVELVVGVVNDRSFGPVLACGAGGAAGELLRDVTVRITPLSERDAGEMLAALKSYPLLEGYRGAPRCDIAAVQDVLLRVSAMVDTHPEIVELDCNPLIASPSGPLIVDARVRVEPAPVPAPVAAVRGAFRGAG